MLFWDVFKDGRYFWLFLVYIWFDILDVELLNWVWRDVCRELVEDYFIILVYWFFFGFNELMDVLVEFLKKWGNVMIRLGYWVMFMIYVVKVDCVVIRMFK